jgi:hypothetical protein
MTTPPTASQPAFVGWYRPSRSARWQQIAAGDSYDATLGELLDKLPAGRTGEGFVTRAGQDPNKSDSRRGSHA